MLACQTINRSYEVMVWALMWVCRRTPGGQPRNIISLSDEDPDAHVMLSSKDARLL